MPFIASMGIYVVSKNVMLDLLREKFPGANDFGSEVIPGATSIGLRVCVPSICLILRRLLRYSHAFVDNIARHVCVFAGASLLVRWLLGRHWYN